MYTYAHTLVTWRQRNNSQTRTHIPARKENKLQRNVHTHIYLCIHGYTPRVKKPTIAALAREFHNDTRHNIIPAFFPLFRQRSRRVIYTPLVNHLALLHNITSRDSYARGRVEKINESPGSFARSVKTAQHLNIQ